MFVFSMNLGEAYNFLVISRIREEAGTRPSLRDAITRAIGTTWGTVTSAGLIRAGTFAIPGLAGWSSEAQQLSFLIAFGLVLDTFFVRTLLVPSIAMSLGNWNWWPSTLATVSGTPTIGTGTVTLSGASNSLEQSRHESKDAAVRGSDRQDVDGRTE
jgi:putative drug exporter of the RND superfamily